jgi:hypothetical protein
MRGGNDLATLLECIEVSAVEALNPEHAVATFLTVKGSSW